MELGFDSKSVDQKGKTAEHYLKQNANITPEQLTELLSLNNTATIGHSPLAPAIGRSMGKHVHKQATTTTTNGAGQNSSTTNDPNNNIINTSGKTVCSPTSKMLGAKPTRLPALPNKQAASGPVPSTSK